MGAEAILQIRKDPKDGGQLNIIELAERLRQEMRAITSEAQRKKTAKRRESRDTRRTGSSPA